MAWSRPRSSPAGSSCFAVASQERLQHAVLLHARRRTTTVSPTSSCRVPRSSRCLSVGSRGWPRAGHRLRRALRPRSESKQARKKERKKERKQGHGARERADTRNNPVSNRAQPERSALRGPTGAGPAASPTYFRRPSEMRHHVAALRAVAWGHPDARQ
jgi:hypothetical protein